MMKSRGKDHLIEDVLSKFPIGNDCHWGQALASLKVEFTCFESIFSLIWEIKNDWYYGTGKKSSRAAILFPKSSPIINKSYYVLPDIKPGIIKDIFNMDLITFLVWKRRAKLISLMLGNVNIDAVSSTICIYKRCVLFWGYRSLLISHLDPSFFA